jgi:NDP-hexose 4-ketoreductase
MEIVGRGFLAHHLQPIAEAHDDVVALAAGVSHTIVTDESAFAREAELVYHHVRRCAADGRRLLFFSTASADLYGRPGTNGHEDGPVYPHTAYGRHKLALEAALQLSSVDHVIVRLSHVIGPLQPPHQLMPSLVRQVRSGAVTIHRGATRDLIHINDAVTIIDRLLGLGLRRDVVNVASGDSAPVEVIVDRIEARLGTRVDRTYVDRTGVTYQVSTDRLRKLVPEVEGMRFEPGYHVRAVDRYMQGLDEAVLV